MGLWNPFQAIRRFLNPVNDNSLVDDDMTDAATTDVPANSEGLQSTTELTPLTETEPPLQPMNAAVESPPVAVAQVLPQGAAAEPFLIHLLASQLKGGISRLNEFNVKDPDILSQIMGQLAQEGRDVANPLSLFEKNREQITDAFNKALEWSQNNDIRVNVRAFGDPDYQPVLDVLKSRQSKKLSEADAQKLQNLFSGMFRESDTADLSNTDGLDKFYLNIKQNGVPDIDLSRAEALQAQQLAATLQPTNQVQARVGFSDRLADTESGMYELSGKMLIGTVVCLGAAAVFATTGCAIPIIGACAPAALTCASWAANLTAFSAVAAAGTGVVGGSMDAVGNMVNLIKNLNSGNQAAQFACAPAQSR